jgi:uncharacterized SAM-binding protein YcdF (DUF218 family)
MFYLFSKLIQPILWPFNIALLLLIAALACRYRRREETAWRLVIAAVAFLLLPALPWISIGLMRSLESSYPSIAASQAPVAEAIVVLGGSIWGAQPPRLEAEEASGSRLVPAARLYRRKKAPFIVVSSGWPYLLPDGKAGVEANDMRDFLVDAGVPEKAIIREDRSRNTDENARYTAEIMKSRGWTKILLVTSAFHLPRAVAIFKKYGVTDVIPFPTEKRVTEGPFRFSFLVPELAALQTTTVAIKEYVGRWVYQ